MIPLDLCLVLFACVAIMCFMMSMQAKWYEIEKQKIVPIAVTLAVTGVIGSEIWFFVENGDWGGRSLYGAIVFSPLVFLAVAKLLKIKYVDSLDFVAPSGCFALAVIKLQCLKDNCCVGKELYQDENFVFVRFPSQIVEMIVFLVISAILFYMSSKPKFRGKIFPWFLIMYGLARFGLDFLRETVLSYLFGLSAGSFWSLCSFIIGVFVLTIIRNKEKRSNVKMQETL
ncbi:MAG: prolipoprotein diacylglyceryl transferase [Oscillospiraceae bacterium]|nr:prolipoprotein diacylglyceryl transferase [Oscillospiraceae bacterium]